MHVIDITATTAGLARVARLLADEPLSPGYVSVVGSLLLFASSGRRMFVACPAAEAAATLRRIRGALGSSSPADIVEFSQGSRGIFAGSPIPIAST
jgi:hypothetical protein